LEAAGVDAGSAIVRPGSFRYEDGLACAPMLRAQDRPTAVVAASDDVALGVLEAARQVGLRVPDDLSVIGFDDTFAAHAASPQLTTVRQPLTQMGRMAVRAAVDGIGTGARPTPPMQMETTLVERSSTAVAPPVAG
jgi:LacI family transcriptional regulator